ncbi:hypothetical protein [Rhizobium rhizogenes]|uniref:hypothetical protein n=1 Tax=Rhizobium rhizogenes TaxID=359 RepID=UPI001E3F4A2D|nr:hypothetical protein [Rhizobium rhizogenes]
MDSFVSIIPLEALVPTLEKIFEAHFRGKKAPTDLFEALNSLNAETEALTPPAVSSLSASGSGSGETNTAVTKFQNLLHSATVNLVMRFAKLPDQAGAYISWLSDLVADVDIAVAEEPWQLIGGRPLSMLTRLKSLFEALRLLAGEAHERKEAPAITWAQRGKDARAGNALRLVSLSAKAAGEIRIAQRKADIERSAEEAGIIADFHLRANAKGILPWPPVDILAVLPASDIPDAVVALAEQAELVRSLVDWSIHLTIMPSVKGVAFPVLARSGYQTLLPNAQGAARWAEELGLPKAPSAMAALFGEVTSLASELGAMDQKGLGTETRPEEEIAARRKLDIGFSVKRDELTRRLDDFDVDLQRDALELIGHLRTGDVDFASESQAALDGTSSNLVEAIGYLSILLMSAEIGNISLEGQLSQRVQAT